MSVIIQYVPITTPVILYSTIVAPLFVGHLLAKAIFRSEEEVDEAEKLRIAREMEAVDELDGVDCTEGIP